MVYPSNPTQRTPSLDELIAGFSKVSGHAAVLLRLNEVLDDDDSGLADLIAVLRVDVGLTARVIAAANTVYFRRGSRVASVEEAVIRVGVAQIRRLLLGSIAYELTTGPLRAYGLGSGEVWVRALACAVAMETLAEETQRSGDACRTIGLMHPLGMIVIDRWVTQHAPRGSVLARASDDSAIEQFELAQVGADNAAVCAHLLETWKFPESCIEAVRFQRRPLEAEQFQRLACLLALARWQATVVHAGHDVRRWPPVPTADVLAAAGMAEESLKATLPVVSAEFSRQKAEFGLL